MGKVWDTTAWANNSMDWDAWADAQGISAFLTGTLTIKPVIVGTLSVGKVFAVSKDPTVAPVLYASGVDIDKE